MPTLLTVQIGLDHIVRESDIGERSATSIILNTIVTGNRENRDSLHSNDA